MKLYADVTRELAAGTLKEGFYECQQNEGICYVLQMDCNWYKQSPGRESFLITKTGPRMFMAKVDPHEALKFLERERRFVESKLAELAEKPEKSGLEVASETTEGSRRESDNWQ